MKKIVVIINGISLPYHVIDYAVNKAKENSSEILGIFLKSTHELPKGYIYPSDLGTLSTETSEEETIAEDEKIIADNIALIKQMMEEKEIPFRAVKKTNAPLEEVKEETASGDIVIVDEKFDEIILGDSEITLQDLKEEFSGSLHVISQEG